MPRPCCLRRVRMEGAFPLFAPFGTGEKEEIELTLDELEAVHLADYEELYQEAAARAMGISRQTFGRIIHEAHRKIAKVLIERKALKIQGGPVRPIQERETMKIAVPTTKEGNVDSHFGHCEKFTLFELNPEGEILKREEVPAPPECGCRSDIAHILSEKGATVLLSGGIGEGAVQVLARYGIQVIRGVYGSAEEAVKKYFAGKLEDSGENCSEHAVGPQGHGSDHGCGHHR